MLVKIKKYSLYFLIFLFFFIYNSYKLIQIKAPDLYLPETVPINVRFYSIILILIPLYFYLLFYLPTLFLINCYFSLKYYVSFKLSYQKVKRLRPKVNIINRNCPILYILRC